MEDLEDLEREKRGIEDSIENFFGEDDFGHTGDQGYQDLLESLDEVEQKINEVLGYKEY